jgi:hypothetical protein
VRLRKGGDGAGCSEDVGRVIEPRNTYRRGQQETAQSRIEGNADGFQWPAGSSPGRHMARAEDPTGV